MGLILGYLSQVFVVAVAVWMAGAFFEVFRMAWIDWRRAAYRHRLGLGPSPFQFTTEDFLVYPLGWPARVWVWLNNALNRMMDPPPAPPKLKNPPQPRWFVHKNCSVCSKPFAPPVRSETLVVCCLECIEKGERP